MSLGLYTVLFAEKCVTKHKRAQEREQLPSTKRRRLLLKQECAKTDGAEKAQEGISYQSGILAQIDKNCFVESEFLSIYISERYLLYGKHISPG